MNRVRLLWSLVALVSAASFLCGCSPQSKPSPAAGEATTYLGMATPGLSPQPFAPHLLPPQGAVMHSAPALAPDGSELYFSAYFADQEPRLDMIMLCQCLGADWSSPQVAPFSGQFNDNWPWFSPDGQRLYFSSQRPPDGGSEATGEYGLWYVERAEGGWSEAQHIAAPGDLRWDEGPIYVAANLPGGYGDMDIYRLQYEDGHYGMPESLGPTVNTAAEEYAPCGAPDGSYVVFTRFEQAEGAQVGLYVTFRADDGSWSEAQDMDASVAAFEGARFPGLSPDGRYLFFVPEGGEAVHWVDAGVLEQFRPGTTSGGG